METIDQKNLRSSDGQAKIQNPASNVPSQPIQAAPLTLTGASPQPERSESPKSKAPVNLHTKSLSPRRTTCKANDLGDSFEPDLYYAARLLFNKGYTDQVIITLEHHLDKLPQAWLAPAYSLLARAYANQGHWEQARRWAESAIARDTLLTEAYYTLALVHEQEGNTEQAVAYLKKVIYLNREGPLPHFNLAMLHKKRGEISSARRNLNHIIKILSQWPPEKIIPGSGGANAARLLNVSRQTLKELEG